MMRGWLRPAVRALLWTGVVVAFVAASLVVAHYEDTGRARASHAAASRVFP